MPQFSQGSLEKLSECHDELQLLFKTVIQTYDCTILVGHRDQAAQEAAFNAGKSKLHYPYGNHNATPSNAVDAAPYPIDWEDTNRFTFFAGYVLGIADRLFAAGIMKHRIRWGGAWSSIEELNGKGVLNDLCHFELCKI